MSNPSAPDPEPPDEISLEEWIESCQSCCGVKPHIRGGGQALARDDNNPDGPAPPKPVE